MKEQSHQKKPQEGISRRNFIRKGAAASAMALSFPYIRTHPVFGAPNTEGIRVGVIGTGRQGRSHLYQPLIYKNVVALCDVDDHMLTQGQQIVVEKDNRSGQRMPAVYKDYRKMLEDKNIDAVLIATPDHWHAQMAIDASVCGKHVYVEKPMALTIYETQQMLKAARKHKVVVQHGTMRRSYTEFRRACEIVRSERIGEVHTVRVGLALVNFNEPARPNSNPPSNLDYDLWLGPAPWRPYNPNHVHYNFRFFWDFAGGQMTNWGAHYIDVAQWGLDKDETGPVEVSNVRVEYDPQNRFEVPAWSEVTFKYADGKRIICGQSQRDGTCFEGVDGTLWVGGSSAIQCSVRGAVEEPLGVDDVHLYKSDNHHQNWYDCIRFGKYPVSDVENGHRSATVCNLGNIACRVGRTIKWDPVKEEIIGDEEAGKYLHYQYRAPWGLPDLG
ncbi:MAG: Gfo/Idh/MocA family protein [Limisphaerales bacterium]|jgi:predicted dehydrogenase|nr:Gfo/Idh/MocA family oxidoreductase [Verrucomicrobiota bacterium]